MSRTRSAVVTLGLGLSLFGVAGVLGSSGPGAATPAGPATTVSLAAPTAASARDLDARTALLRQRLRTVPADWRSWAALGSAYVQQARVTADPTWYPKAEEALQRSLDLQPVDNLDALVGGSSLAAGRHDFARAAQLAARAVHLAPYSAGAQAVLGDALVELGRYPEAFTAYQRLNDLQPGLTAYVRAAYAAELQGNLDRADGALVSALPTTTDPADTAFVLVRRGELAWIRGDDEAAGRLFARARTLDPRSPEAQAGVAKVAAARGDTAGALATYGDLVGRVPAPGFVSAYGDLLASLGRDAEAQEQYDLVDLQRGIARSSGVLVDLEAAVSLADRGQAVAAVAAAEAEYARRRTVVTEDALAWALHAAGRDREALPLARAALRLGTRDPLVRFHAAVVEDATGDRSAAHREVSAALRQPSFSTRFAPEARALQARTGDLGNGLH